MSTKVIGRLWSSALIAATAVSLATLPAEAAPLSEPTIDEPTSDTNTTTTTSTMGTTTTAFKAVQSGKGWVDFNGDGRADYCRVWSDSYIACTVSTGTGYGATYTAYVDQGYAAGRAWADVTGDGKADYCRIVGMWDKYLNCTPSTGTGFGPTFGSGRIDPGYDAGRAWADVTGDGRADYCRVVDDWGLRLQCTPSAGTSFGATFGSGEIDAGYDAGRAWADVTGDRRADYCRVTGAWDNFVHCTPSTGSGFGSTFGSGKLDAGYDATRAWADVNRDGRADFCRGVGANDRAVCTFSNGDSFGSSISRSLDMGYDAGRGWADFNADGTADLCRVVGAWSRWLRCDLAGGSGFGTTSTSSQTVDAGYDDTRGWADFNADGRADYCRVVGGSSKYLQCTLSTGSGFGTTYTSGVVNYV